MVAVNTPEIVAEITTLHDDYERALIANDIEALVGFFWPSPYAVRFGVAEQLYGADAITAYRQAGAPLFTDRQMIRRTVVTFGADTASIMSEFTLKIGGQPRRARQSQLWVRFAELGWKIVAAHVSNAINPATGVWDAYLDRAAAALGLPIAAQYRPGVAQNLERSSAIAAPLLAFELPAEAEIAPVFVP